MKAIFRNERSLSLFSLWLLILVTVMLIGYPIYSHAAPVFNPATGHYYDTVTGGTWGDAEAQATALGRHLVTINDATEQQ